MRILCSMGSSRIGVMLYRSWNGTGWSIGAYMELDGAYSGWIIFASVIRLVASVVSIVVHACMIDRHLCILLFSAFACISTVPSIVAL
jgi:hypothetical protein